MRLWNLHDHVCKVLSGSAGLPHAISVTWLFASNCCVDEATGVGLIVKKVQKTKKNDVQKAAQALITKWKAEANAEMDAQ